MAMEILSVTLKNFKSHRDRHFQFQPGTNAICGENGAGKTSILKAIAWTLFNYRGSYTKAKHSPVFNFIVSIRCIDNYKTPSA
jgi:DNA repair exonuclease SbcCD ATPase subunit